MRAVFQQSLSATKSESRPENIYWATVSNVITQAIPWRSDTVDFSCMWKINLDFVHGLCITPFLIRYKPHFSFHLYEINMHWKIDSSMTSLVAALSVYTSVVTFTFAKEKAGSL